MRLKLAKYDSFRDSDLIANRHEQPVDIYRYRFLKPSNTIEVADNGLRSVVYTSRKTERRKSNVFRALLPKNSMDGASFYEPFRTNTKRHPARFIPAAP